jgi:YjjW family glycine radical enzyme activase
VNPPTSLLAAVRGLVADVIPFSCVDGPGNRFVVFLQGCNLDCIACHNPYTITVCNNCGECVAQCPSAALSIIEDGTVEWDADACTGSDRCIAWCPYDSTPKAVSTSVAEMVEQVRRAAPFLSGVTVSGGEATQQPAFVQAFFAALAADPELARLTRFVDSNGMCPPHIWHDLGPVLDGAMIDLKAIDDDVHRLMTGHGNADILRSIRLLADAGSLYEVRLLFVPGVNDSTTQIERTAAFLRAVDPWMRVKVIGFRCHGVRPTPLATREPTAQDLQRYTAVLHAEGLHQLTVI